MLSIKTFSRESFTAMGGETVPYSELFDAILTSVEVYGRSGGKEMTADELKDLSQDSTYKAVRYAYTFDPCKAKLQTWASRIVGNAARDAFARSMRAKETFTSLEYRFSVKDSDQNQTHYDYCLEFSASGSYATDFEAEYNEAEVIIEGAIDSLNERYATIIRLTRDGMSPSEIADELGCPASVVCTVLCRARKALLRKLGPSYLP